MSSKNDNKRTFSETQLPIVPELKKIKVTSKSNFFTPTIIDRYVSSILLEPNKTIMNIDQLFEYFGRSDRSPLDIANQLKIGIQKEAICSGIYLKYLEQVLERSIETNGTYINYDIAFIIDISIPKSIEEIEKAIIALIIGILPNVPGFLTTIGIIGKDAVWHWLSQLYNYAWFVGFFVSGICYLVLMRKYYNK